MKIGTLMYRLQFPFRQCDNDNVNETIFGSILSRIKRFFMR